MPKRRNLDPKPQEDEGQPTGVARCGVLASGAGTDDAGSIADAHTNLLAPKQVIDEVHRPPLERGGVAPVTRLPAATRASVPLCDGSPPAGFPGGFYARRGKRWLDVALAVATAVVLAPAMLAVVALIWLRLGPPILFRQERVGRGEEVFRLFKFRTMTGARDAAGRLLPDEARLTPLGLFLRRWSLDELPQIFNVLRGETSLVGPRPLLVRYLSRYTTRQRQRHAVRPGITGWAQANGRNSLSWGERLEYDVWYVLHLSLAVDLRVFWLTVRRGLRRSEVAPGGAAEVGEFWGTAEPPANAHWSYPSEELAAAEREPGAEP
jgi:lipopolysaccharide/colanic/teichoic acid biosynthesis glycosyltransferase